MLMKSSREPIVSREFVMILKGIDGAPGERVPATIEIYEPEFKMKKWRCELVVTVGTKVHTFVQIGCDNYEALEFTFDRARIVMDRLPVMEFEEMILFDQPYYGIR